MKLAAYLRKQKISDSEFASQIGVTRQAVHRYRVGGRLPAWSVIQKIRTATDGAVSVNDFSAGDRCPTCMSPRR
jgi:predicted transcriptional regulator